MVNEIESRVLSLDGDGERGFSAVVVFGADFAGFRGHFPGRPVLPGVCQILALSVLANRAAGRPLRLNEVSRAKFLSVIEPEDEVHFEFTLSRGDATTVLNGNVRVRDKGVAGKFRLVFGA